MRAAVSAPQSGFRDRPSHRIWMVSASENYKSLRKPVDSLLSSSPGPATDRPRGQHFVQDGTEEEFDEEAGDEPATFVRR